MFVLPRPSGRSPREGTRILGRRAPGQLSGVHGRGSLDLRIGRSRGRPVTCASRQVQRLRRAAHSPAPRAHAALDGFCFCLVRIGIDALHGFALAIFLQDSRNKRRILWRGLPSNEPLQVFRPTTWLLREGWRNCHRRSLATRCRRRSDDYEASSAAAAARTPLDPETQRSILFGGAWARGAGL